MENKNIGNYYGATPDRPYHLSVGAVILDKANQVLCLHYALIDELRDVYKLPTCTVKMGERLEETLSRRVREETGYEVEIITFLGTQVINDTWWKEHNTPTEMEKSTVFFLARIIEGTERQDVTDNDNGNIVVESQTLDFLKAKMQQQPLKDGMRDFDQSDIITRAVVWMTEHPGLTSPTL